MFRHPHHHHNQNAAGNQPEEQLGATNPAKAVGARSDPRSQPWRQRPRQSVARVKPGALFCLVFADAREHGAERRRDKDDAESKDVTGEYDHVEIAELALKVDPERTTGRGIPPIPSSRL